MERLHDIFPADYVSCVLLSWWVTWGHDWGDLWVLTWQRRQTWLDHSLCILDEEYTCFYYRRWNDTFYIPRTVHVSHMSYPCILQYWYTPLHVSENFILSFFLHYPTWHRQTFNVSDALCNGPATSCTIIHIVKQDITYHLDLRHAAP